MGETAADRVVGRFWSAGIRADVWCWGPWWLIIAPRHGMRVLQVGHGERLFLWNAPNPSPENWCIGGNRTWLAPEFSNEASRRHGLFEPSEGRWEIPSGLDPGPYDGERIHDDAWRGTTTISAPGLHLGLTRDVRIHSVVGGERSALVVDVASTLINLYDGPAPFDVGLWSITQVEPDLGAYAAIPIRREPRHDRDHAPRVDTSAVRLRDGELPHVAIQRRKSDSAETSDFNVSLPPGRFFKAGFGRDAASGSVRYLRETSDGVVIGVEQVERMERRSRRELSPAANDRYVDFGDVVQVFNSREEEGPFAEIETHRPVVPVPRDSGTTGWLTLAFTVQSA